MRAIDADAVPQEFWEYEFDGKWRGCTIKDLLDSQPTIQPEPHWIPVTEEPIPDGEYLATWTSEIQEKPILSIICRYSGVWDCWELQMLGHQNINVLAYMELPEPYKGVTT